MIELAYIDHYDSFTFNVIDWLTSLEACKVHHVPFDDEKGMGRVLTTALPLVISPGPKSPAEALPTVQLLQQSIGQRPILGVCLGHQLLAYAVGGATVRSLVPLHGAARRVRVLDDSGILQGMPPVFEMGAYNSLTVPPPAPVFQVTAVCEDGEVQVIESLHAVGRRAFGVQFHPESFLSTHQDILLRNWFEEIAAYR